MTFKLDTRLQNDTVFIASVDNCQIRLSKDARYPWLLLIPEINELTEFDDLDWDQQIGVLKVSNMLSQVLRNVYHPDKINIASIGNIVKQLHIHHVARFEYDSAWPNPIWGRGDSVLYDDTTLASEIDKIKTALSKLYQGE